MFLLNESYKTSLILTLAHFYIKLHFDSLKLCAFDGIKGLYSNLNVFTRVLNLLNVLGGK